MSGQARGCGHSPAAPRGRWQRLGTRWVAPGGCGPVGTSCWWHSQHRVAKGEQWLRDRQSTACSHPQGIEAGGTPQSGWATLCQISMKSREPVLRHQRAPQRPAGATGGGELFLAPARMLGSRRDRAASRLERRRGAIFSSERVFANEACEQQRCWGAPTVPGTHSPT